MEIEFTKIASEVAGIGGLALAVVVIIFRKILSMKIFPELNRKDAYRLLNRVLIFAFLTMALGLGAWLYNNNLNRGSTSESKPTSNRNITIDNKNGRIGNVVNGDNNKINSYQIDTITKE